MQLVVNDVHTSSPIRIDPDHGLSEKAFYEFCLANPDLRIEQTSGGAIEIMPPTALSAGYRNNEISRQLGNWSKADGRGLTFDSSTAFRLPSRALRSPDASWVLRSRLQAFSKNEKESSFLSLTPEFIIELRSASDSLSRLQAKMGEWMDNGVLLGWLIDPSTRKVHVYRPGSPPEVVAKLSRLRGEGPVQGFQLDLTDIWAEL
ncbi:MAG TPA: Uma2 family endonuclease [Bryobacteraceae bacterium]|nr:Uma2 family endonuclease [Bryobacteraceae bacterium]